ncbi:pentapeptide repeat-containing protein [Ascidiimonas sp. W6]|uniref:pentapeptide repeat-containing protein n=1 Tax=Ascidiimonas meishanensis TaxID=3128903 RepID=UPI0030EE485E
MFSTQTVTAIGVSITAVIGIFLATKANDLFDQQNKFIEKQTFLEESTRRSALVFELSSILDEIDEELDLIESKSGYTISPGIIANFLSPRLQGRIIAISNSLKPYKYLNENGELTSPLSPERGQLLISLVLAGTNIDYIIGNSDFSYADLSESNLLTKNLSKINLKSANLKQSVFHGSKLILADLSSSDLSNSNMNFTNLSFAKLNNANINGCDFEGAYLPNSENFRGAKMDSINLQFNTVLDSLWLDKFFKLKNVPKNYRRKDFDITKDRELNRSFAPYEAKTVDTNGNVLYDSMTDTTTRVVYRIKNLKNPSSAKRLKINEPIKFNMNSN